MPGRIDLVTEPKQQGCRKEKQPNLRARAVNRKIPKSGTETHPFHPAQGLFSLSKGSLAVFYGCSSSQARTTKAVLKTNATTVTVKYAGSRNGDEECGWRRSSAYSCFLWRIRRCYSHYEMMYMESIHSDEIHKMVIAG
jgi:hypothetical protein